MRPAPAIIATAASRIYEGFSNHAFPRCFVCGPDRDEGEGLRIFPGLLEGGAVAAPWVPHRAFADEGGVVRVAA